MLAVLLIVVGAVAGVLVVKLLPDSNSENSPGLTSSTVIRKDISSSVLATGVIKPMVGAEVRVGSRSSGMVEHLYVGIGDYVEQGQLLAELDDDALQANLFKAEAALEIARAELEFSELNINRKRTLAEKNLLSDDDLEQAEKNHRLNQLRVEQAVADVNYVETQLTYTRILAPIAGVVATVSTQEGETVAASFSTPTFVTIINLNKLELWAYVDETDIGRIDQDQKATFRIDTYPETDFKGTVVAIYPNAVIQNTVVNYVVIIQIEDRQGKSLRPEMTANVTIQLETHENTLAVSREAVRRDRGRYVVNTQENGQLVERQVRVGWRDATHTEILEGLSEGDTVWILER